MSNIKGKVSIIKHPLIKGKEGRTPLEGDWQYENGILTSKWMIGGRKTINLAIATKSVELAPEPLPLLAGLKKSNELTPEYMAAGMASPLLMNLFQDRKFKDLRNNKILLELQFKETFELPMKFSYCGWTDGILAFTTLEIFAEIHDLIKI
jgi:hypothetical protein